jgi:hypothetical protein
VSTGAVWPPRPDAPSAGEPARRSYPPAGWPTHAQLTYTKEAITALLLVLALPWLVSKLLTDPGAVLAGLGQRQVTKAAS